MLSWFWMLKRKLSEAMKYTHTMVKNTGIDPIKFAQKAQDLGAGEIIINSIDNDGMMKGFDTKIVDKIRQVVTIPITVLGGAGSLDDIKKVIQAYGIIGVSAGSLFVFKESLRQC